MGGAVIDQRDVLCQQIDWTSYWAKSIHEADWYPIESLP